MSYIWPFTYSFYTMNYLLSVYLFFSLSLLVSFEHPSLPRMTTAEEISSRTVTRALQGSHDIHSFRAQSVSIANHNLPHWQVLLIWEDASVILPVKQQMYKETRQHLSKNGYVRHTLPLKNLEYVRFYYVFIERIYYFYLARMH